MISIQNKIIDVLLSIIGRKKDAIIIDERYARSLVESRTHDLVGKLFDDLNQVFEMDWISNEMYVVLFRRCEKGRGKAKRKAPKQKSKPTETLDQVLLSDIISSGGESQNIMEVEFVESDPKEENVKSSRGKLIIRKMSIGGQNDNQKSGAK